MQLPFHHLHKVLPRLQGAWDKFREAIPPCTERDEKIRLAKRRHSNDTELAAMSGYGSSEPDAAGAAYTNFGAGEEGDIMDTKLNGDVVIGEEFGFVDESGGDDGGGGGGGEFGTSTHKISEWQAGWNVTNAIQVTVLKYV